MHWQFGEMEFGEMKRNTSNWSNFCMLLRRAGAKSKVKVVQCALTTYTMKRQRTNVTDGGSSNDSWS